MKKDLIVSLVIGELCAWLIILIAKNLLTNFSFWWLLPIVFPILCALGMLVALFFENRLRILYQFAKFFLVGGMNTLLDLGILNLLILLSGVGAGLFYTLFKGTSFVVATINSYYWNKFWTFKAARGSFNQFLVVSGIGFLVNVGAATFIVNFVGPQFGLALKTWANVGAALGSVMGLLWNFVGYKFIVFK